MATYYLFGKYSQDSLKQISSQRTQKAKEIIQKTRRQSKIHGGPHGR